MIEIQEKIQAVQKACPDLQLSATSISSGPTKNIYQLLLQLQLLMKMTAVQASVLLILKILQWWIMSCGQT